MKIFQAIQEVTNYGIEAINEEINMVINSRRRRKERRKKLLKKLREIISEEYSTQIYLTGKGKIHYEHEKIVSKEGIIY